MLFKDEFTSALLMSVLVTVIVLFTTPSSHTQSQQDPVGYKLRLAVKTFLIAFVILFAILYFSQDGSSDPMQHIITGEPNF